MHQHAFAQRLRIMKVAQRLANRIDERHRVGALGHSAVVSRKGHRPALADDPRRRRLGTPVVHERTEVPAADFEVGLRRAYEMHTLEVRLPERGIGHVDHAPRRLGVRDQVRDDVHRGEIDGCADCLMQLRMHPLAQHDQLVGAGQRPVSLDEAQRRGHGRIGAIRRRRVGGQAQHQQEPVALARCVPEQRKPARWRCHQWASHRRAAWPSCTSAIAATLDSSAACAGSTRCTSSADQSKNFSLCGWCRSTYNTAAW